MDRLIAETVDRFGGVDIFVANAGIGGAVLPLLEQTEEEFVNVDLRESQGHVSLCQSSGKADDSPGARRAHCHHRIHRRF